MILDAIKNLFKNIKEKRKKFNKTSKLNKTRNMLNEAVDELSNLKHSIVKLEKTREMEYKEYSMKLVHLKNKYKEKVDEVKDLSSKFESDYKNAYDLDPNLTCELPVIDEDLDKE